MVVTCGYGCKKWVCEKCGYGLAYVRQFVYHGTYKYYYMDWAHCYTGCGYAYCPEDNWTCRNCRYYVWDLDSMLPTLKLLDEIGVEETCIIRTTEEPRWNQNAAGATLELHEYFDEMLKVVSAYTAEDCQMNLDIWQMITVFPKDKKYRIRPVECGIGEYRDSIPVCRGNRGMVAVAANGNVFPCIQMSGYYEAKNDILGNVKKDGLQPLLQAGRYLSEVCATVGTLAKKNEMCGNCPYFKHCVGGCRAIALTLTGDKFGVDLSKCLFFKKGYYERIVAIMGDWKNLSKIQMTTN